MATKFGGVVTCGEDNLLMKLHEPLDMYLLRSQDKLKRKYDLFSKAYGH